MLQTTTKHGGAKTQFFPRPGAVSFKRLLGASPLTTSQHRSESPQGFVDRIGIGKHVHYRGIENDNVRSFAVPGGRDAPHALREVVLRAHRVPVDLPWLSLSFALLHSLGARVWWRVWR